MEYGGVFKLCRFFCMVFWKHNIKEESNIIKCNRNLLYFELNIRVRLGYKLFNVFLVRLFDIFGCIYLKVLEKIG